VLAGPEADLEPDLARREAEKAVRIERAAGCRRLDLEPGQQAL